MNNYILTENKLTEFVRQQCDKRPRLCSAVKIAGSIAGASLIIKGAMNYQKVQTMECYKRKPSFKSKYDSEYSSYQLVAKQYDKLAKQREQLLSTINNSPMTTSERQEKKHKLQHDLDVLKVKVDEHKQKLDKMVEEIRDCSNDEKDIINENLSSEKQSILKRTVSRLKKKYSCDNPRNAEKLRCDPMEILMTAGMIYGGYKAGNYMREKWNKNIDKKVEGIVTEEDLKKIGIEIPDDLKKAETEFRFGF